MWLFLILLLAWLLKTTTSVLQPGGNQIIHSTGELVNNAALGYIPGLLVVMCVLSFYLWLLYVILKHRETTGELAYGEVHV
jgi:uncharacterized membrane protein